MNSFQHCPIDKEDILASRSKSSSWDYYHSLCDALDDKNINHKRIIMFGGSVTTGLATDGCICDDNYNICPSNTPSDLYNDSIIECRWGSRLDDWWSQYMNNSSLHVLSIGGTTTAFMADVLESKLLHHSILNLSSNDIILIDHSVNDGISLSSKNGQKELIEGLDRFIRNIYKLSVPGSWPTIVLLELWSYSNMYHNIDERPDHLSVNQSQYDYSNSYIKAAKAYGLPIWSYRDIVWSKHFEHQYDDYSKNLLRFIENSNYVHPSWVIHLYYADLIASNLKYESNLCRNNNNKKHVLDSNKMYLDKLIAPISKDPALECKQNSINLLDLSATSFYKSLDLDSPMIGRFKTNPSDSFMVYEDRPGKVGWIDEINNNDYNYKSTLTFYFNNLNNQLSDHLYILKLYYFRTYYNGGIFNVSLCDEYINTLDTLWTEVNYKTSETRIYQLKLDPNEYKYCPNSTIAKLTFTHMNTKENHFYTRQKQKVKIVGVKICESSSDLVT